MIYEKLTKREAQVLGLIADGLNNKRMAKVLKVAESTIKTHANNIIGKFLISTRVGAVAIGFREGYLK